MRRRIFEGDNRRKKSWGTLATLVTVACWGASRIGRFLVKNGKVKKDQCMPEHARKDSGKFVCKSRKSAGEKVKQEMSETSN
ncbi:hypothetical protein B7486_01215 [cyanobacterium TDX16]|nr:hypothetical protein B7486_01215 [cyanobacterium TDX16]